MPRWRPGCCSSRRPWACRCPRGRARLPARWAPATAAPSSSRHRPAGASSWAPAPWRRTARSTTWSWTRRAEARMDRRGYGVLAATVFTALLLFFLYSIAEVLLLFFIGVLLSLYLG